MRFSRIVAALCVLAAVLFASTASAAQRKRDCRTSGKTYAANADVRVLYFLDPGGGGRTFYACDVRAKRRRILGAYYGPDGGITPKIALVGRYVAYEDIICDRDGSCSGSVYRLDVVRDRTYVVEVTDSGALPAKDLAMSSTHAVYWIRRTAAGFAVVRGASGDVRVLEDGPGVEPGSLAVKGRRAYWTTAGQPRSSTE